ncbi:hypothetical protein FC093_00515 [Ilyomonas limi]|uniref:Uncharacterized protein n=1 Tax=Ilyomonas limi TaxID=2575867 RepID=A0A4V5UV37_9BACT|nr:hypothetical protein [Ilyomonas limi]TKK71543.1 hypothetical protein FC093_00515 [Ilyomonas limi]
MKKLCHLLSAVIYLVILANKGEAQFFKFEAPNTKSSAIAAPHTTSVNRLSTAGTFYRENAFGNREKSKEAAPKYYSSQYKEASVLLIDKVQQLSSKNDSLMNRVLQLQDSLYSIVTQLKEPHSNNDVKPAMDTNTSNKNVIKFLNNMPVAYRSSEGAKNVRLNNINIQVIRDFINNYKEANNEAWYSTGDAFVAKFSIGRVSTTVTYKKNGEWLYTIKNYFENDMTKELRTLVKSSYYDYQIVKIEEIEVPRKERSIFLIYVQDTKKIIILRVYDGEMEVLHNYTRG